MLVRKLAALVAAAGLLAVAAAPATASPPVGCAVTIVKNAVQTGTVRPCP